MFTNSRYLDKHGYAICGCCRKKLYITELEEPCEFCHKVFCHDCAREVPPGHGYGKICVRCYEKLKRRDRK